MEYSKIKIESERKRKRERTREKFIVVPSTLGNRRGSESSQYSCRILRILSGFRRRR